MCAKTVRIEEDVYERVKAHKRPEESFSEAIDRLMEGWSLLDLAGTMTDEEAAEQMAAIEESEDATEDDTAELLERQGIDVETL